MTRLLIVTSIVLAGPLGCGGEGGGDGDDACTGDACACTPEAQAVAGAALSYDALDLLTDSAVGCDHVLLTSAADVAAAFPNGDAPPGVANADFTIDRIVLQLSNPALEFAIDDGARLVVGIEPLCQGAAPSCVAYTIHGTTRASLEVSACPYRGPDPCLAP